MKAARARMAVGMLAACVIFAGGVSRAGTCTWTGGWDTVPSSPSDGIVIASGGDLAPAGTPKAVVESLEPTEMRLTPASRRPSSVKPGMARILTGLDTAEQTAFTVSMSERAGA